MLEDLKKLRQDLIGAEKILDEKRMLLAGFQGRVDAITTEIADKKFELETCELEQRNLIVQVTRGEAEEKSVFRNSKERERLHREIGELEVIVAGFPAAKESLRAEVKKSEEELKTRVRIFWEGVTQIEKQKFTPAMHAVLLKCWACHVLAGNPLSFGEWVKVHFQNYDSNDFSRLEKELQREYLAKEVK
jgi:hypothetical protein